LAVDPDNAVRALRGKITRHWRDLKTSARRKAWASANGLTVDELKTYILTDPRALPFPKQVALASAARAAGA
jgi:hypothetical protein